MDIGRGMKVFDKEWETVSEVEVPDEEWGRVYEEQWDQVCDKEWDRVSEKEQDWVSEKEWDWVSEKERDWVSGWVYVVGWQGWRTLGNFPRAADDLATAGSYSKAGIRCTPVEIEKRKRCELVFNITRAFYK